MFDEIQKLFAEHDVELSVVRGDDTRMLARTTSGRTVLVDLRKIQVCIEGRNEWMSPVEGARLLSILEIPTAFGPRGR